LCLTGLKLQNIEPFFGVGSQHLQDFIGRQLVQIISEKHVHGFVFLGFC
jgi:hypothetical protein